MWVKIKKTYSGPEGFFVAGSVMDLPEETAKALGKNCQSCPAPWDEYKDTVSENRYIKQKAIADKQACIDHISKHIAVAEADLEKRRQLVEAAQARAERIGDSAGAEIAEIDIEMAQCDFSWLEHWIKKEKLQLARAEAELKEMTEGKKDANKSAGKKAETTQPKTTEKSKGQTVQAGKKPGQIQK